MATPERLFSSSEVDIPTEELVLAGEASSAEVQGLLILGEDGRTMEVVEIVAGQQIKVLVKEDSLFMRGEN